MRWLVQFELKGWALGLDLAQLEEASDQSRVGADRAKVNRRSG